MRPGFRATSAAILLCSASPALAQESGGGEQTAEGDRVVVEGERTAPLELDTEVADDGSIQDEVTGGEATETVTSYSPDYFRPFSPTSAQDMVNRVPGFDARGGGNARGFGQNAGNVLINGERPSSKSQSVGDILQRIPVSEVVRIDLIRGSVAGIDMGGQSVVVNVIRRVSSRAGGTWRLQAQYNSYRDSLRPTGEVSYNTSLLGANVTLGLQINQFAFGDESRRQIDVPPAGLEQFVLSEGRGGRPLGYTATLNAERDLGEWTLRLNGRYEDGGFRGGNYSEVLGGAYRPGDIDDDDPRRLLYYDVETSNFENDQTDWEVGGDLERRLTDNLSLKLIGLKSRHEQTGSSNRVEYDALGAVTEIDTSSKDVSGETIGRAFVTWNPVEHHSVEIGAEVAYNFLDTSNDYQFARRGVPIGGGGGAGDIDTTKVEELRGEPFITWLWRVTDTFSLNTALQAEVSKIEQSGDASKSRKFFYPKGSVSATWDVLEETQLRVTLDRRVGQLSFGDFRRSIDFQDETEDEGNPDLVPEQSWRLDGVLEQRFWDDGVISLSADYEWIEDKQGLVPLVGGGVGTGSMGDATEWRVRLEADVPLDRVIWDDARIRFNMDYGSSEVVDPFTGQTRTLGGHDRGFFVGFRKDYPEEGFSWGGSFRNNGPLGYSYRPDELTVFENYNNGFEAFVETTRFFGVNMRLQVNNIGNFYSDNTRYLFDGPRDTAPLRSIEATRQYDDWNASFRVRGTF